MTDDTLNQMYATYRDNCPDTPALSFEDWYNDYYLDDVWVCGSLAAKDDAWLESLTDDELDALLEKRRRVRKIAYDKHDAQVAAKAFQNLMVTEEQTQLSGIISYNMMFEMREET